MARKLVSLPIVQSIVDDALAGQKGAPTVDEARRQLGGRAVSTLPIGGVVRARGPAGAEQVAVVIFANDLETCIWMGDGIIRCVRSGEPLLPAEEVPANLEGVADDVRVFASLAEGNRVRYQVAGSEMQDGVLLEKCRFGALVGTASGRTMAVVFRLLWPVPDSSS